jgi:anthranilate/para-aminobenzoate synthase component I
MPVHRIPLAEWVAPERAYLALFAGEGESFWLDSADDAGRSWMGSRAGGDALLTASVSRGEYTRDIDGSAESEPGTIFDALRLPAADAPIGWVGWLGYELGTQTAGVALPQSDVPDAALLRPSRVLEFDHDARTVHAVVAGTDEDAKSWAGQVGARLAASATPEPVADARAHPEPAHWRHGAEDYVRLIGHAQAAIGRGDAYQLCLTNTMSVRGAFDPVETYRRLRTTSPSHHAGLLRFGEIALLSSSPEQFLGIEPSGRMRTKPIKGTRPRSASIARDIELRSELESSGKEQAENLMIVDLMRNDLGRVAQLGTVVVTSLLAVESYAQVHQLVSTIEANLAPGLSAIDAIEACFPAGSMTGAPKISALGILAQLEAGPRGIYSGVFGRIDPGGYTDLAMVIRSIVLGPDAATIGTGGGITSLSVQSEELEETRVKARALLAALGVRS